MGDKVEKLVELARVVVPPHTRVVDGKLQRVDGYTYDTRYQSGGPPEEENAFMMRQHLRRKHGLTEEQIGIEPTGDISPLKRLHNSITPSKTMAEAYKESQSPENLAAQRAILQKNYPEGIGARIKEDLAPEADIRVKGNDALPDTGDWTGLLRSFTDQELADALDGATGVKRKYMETELNRRSRLGRPSNSLAANNSSDPSAWLETGGPRPGGRSSLGRLRSYASGFRPRRGGMSAYFTNTDDE